VRGARAEVEGCGAVDVGEGDGGWEAGGEEGGDGNGGGGVGGGGGGDGEVEGGGEGEVAGDAVVFVVGVYEEFLECGPGGVGVS